MTQGMIKAISISASKGVAKTNIARAQLQCDHGIVGDAHAGPWHRQISLLAVESIEKMVARGARVGPGDFAENITTEGLDLGGLSVGSRLRLGDAVELEITQFGKQCHSRCAIFHQVGDCIMPREGVFAKVVRPGWITTGDRIEVCDARGASCVADRKTQTARRTSHCAAPHDARRPTRDESAPRARYDIGFEEALAGALRALSPLAPVDVPVSDAGGMVLAEDCTAQVHCPSSPISLKDGYAVVSTDLADACASRPVKLRIVGTAAAGSQVDAVVRSGTAVRILSGARVPVGADAVIASEFTIEQGHWVLCRRDAASGRNVVEQGQDVSKGSRIAVRGQMLTPAETGLLAAGGVAAVRVHPLPRVGIIATGDEVVTPGNALNKGQLYASNVITLRSWLRRFHVDAEMAVVGDHKERLAGQAARMLERVDVLITSGGAWKSDRDLTVEVLKAMGADLVFHRVRMGPGKAVALLVFDGKPLFCLPGGPPSNEVAFLQIALPSLLHLAGRPPVPLEHARGVLTERVRGDKHWTQFIYADLGQEDGKWLVRPLNARSRLQSQASASALLRVPEGVEQMEPGTWVDVQVLHGFSRAADQVIPPR